MGVKLGKKYRDTITGYEGTATGRAEYLNGCISVLLEGEGETKQRWVDEPRLEGVVSRAKAGGPREAPPSRDPQ